MHPPSRSVFREDFIFGRERQACPDSRVASKSADPRKGCNSLLARAAAVKPRAPDTPDQVEESCDKVMTDGPRRVCDAGGLDISEGPPAPVPAIRAAREGADEDA
jgi:hypothetical protein